MRYFYTLLLITNLTTAVLAQPSHQDLLYSADVTTGEARLFGGVTLENEFPVIDTQQITPDFGPVWKIEAGKFMALHVHLPVAIENCRLKVRELGLPRETQESISLLLINNHRLQRLEAAEPSQSQTRFYNLANHLRAGENQLKLAGLEHDLGLQSLVIHCTAPLPMATTSQKNQQNSPRITLLAPLAGQAIVADKPLEIVWATANLPKSARVDLDYFDKNGQWLPIDKGIPHNYPFLQGQRGVYRWQKLPADVHPQLQVRLRYDTEQPAAGSLWTEPTTGMKFVYIPAGCFHIGNQKSQPRVCLNGFWMGQTEVTNAQYKNKQNHDSGYDQHPDRNFDGDEQPVVNVTRPQANAFARWLSQRNTGKTFRLPTEAQWEYAALAGQSTLFYWDKDKSNQACQYANIADRTFGRVQNIKNVQPCDDKYAITAPVAQFKPNAFKLYDLIGNVAEWTCSAKSSNKYSSDASDNYSGANTCDTFGFSAPSIRGSSWQYSGDLLKLTERTWFLNDLRQIGFRLIRE
jgi:sulfatase modifying factor 1